ncbi:hypothetical protein CIP107534_02018 [Corynebacterium diphtheriae]|nr:hypothetical protein CIP107534_02018 [Corynebacterium diphtheriae]
MFKRSIASVAAVAVVAVVSGAVVAPANAMSAKFNNSNMTCTIELTDKEVKLTLLQQTLMIDKAKAAQTKAIIAEPQVSALRAKIEDTKKELAKLEPHSEKSEKLRRELEENTEKFTAYQNFLKALNACIAGEDYNSDQSGVPNQPGPSEPSVPNQPGPSEPSVPNQPGPSEPSVPNQPGPSEPSVPNQPEGERALPSTNGAVIGVIVAVLGILAAALPVIKSMLRALLP